MFNQYCCSFYGSPLWSISGAAVQALCVDWRKALRSMWRLNPRTHCDLITALSSQIPLIVSLKKRFAMFINRCLSSHNTTLQFISCVAINNPFSRTGTNYRDLLNYHGILNSNNVIQSEWSKKLIPLHNDVKTLQELIEIRDGYKECFGFTQEDINNFITNLCTK